MSAEWRNWAGDQRCLPSVFEEPDAPAGVARVIERAVARDQIVRVVGGAHSANDGPMTDDAVVSLKRMGRLIDLDKSRGEVRVEAGIELNRLNDLLWEEGFALPNLGDIGDQSVGGALSTATHGTGIRLPHISAGLREAVLVLADGSTLRVSERIDAEMMRAIRVNVGALGILTEAVLAVVPAFTLAGRDSPMPTDRLLADLDHLLRENDHFQFYKFPYSKIALARVANRVEGPPQPPSRVRATVEDAFQRSFGPICRIGRARPWLIPQINRVVARSAGTPRRIDRSYRLLNRPQPVPFTEMEYAIPRDAVKQAIPAIDEVTERHRFAAPFPLQVRFAAADNAMLSPTTGRETCYVAVHMYQGMPWRPYFEATEEILGALGGRPHWGKRHALSAAQLGPLYPEWASFADLRAHLDPEGRFVNRYVSRVLGAPARSAVVADE
jgi:L-gulonolactone oxidase